MFLLHDIEETLVRFWDGVACCCAKDTGLSLEVCMYEKGNGKLLVRELGNFQTKPMGCLVSIRVSVVLALSRR